MRTHKHLVSVTADGPFAYVQFGCGHVTISREDDKIILTAGPGCKLDNHEFVEINVVADQCPGSPSLSGEPKRTSGALTRGS